MRSCGRSSAILIIVNLITNFLLIIGWSDWSCFLHSTFTEKVVKTNTFEEATTFTIRALLLHFFSTFVKKGNSAVTLVRGAGCGIRMFRFGTPQTSETNVRFLSLLECIRAKLRVEVSCAFKVPVWRVFCCAIYKITDWHLSFLFLASPLESVHSEFEFFVPTGI